MKYTINNEEVDRVEYFVAREDGDYKSFYENGQLQEEMFFVNRKPHGAWKIFCEDGSLRYMQFFVHGTPRSEIFEEEHKLERVLLLGTSEIRVKHEDKNQS